MKQMPAIDVPKGMREMVEAVAAILGLFSVCVFAAHAVDAYRAHGTRAVRRSVPREIPQNAH